MDHRHVGRAGILLAVLAVGAAGGWVSAQSIAPRAVTPRVLSGGDVGFRVEAQRGDTVIGRIVVRIDGEWVEAESAAGPLRLLQGSH